MSRLPAFARVYPEQATALVSCPRCGAAAGVECDSLSVPRLHHHRVEAAEAELARQFARQYDRKDT